LKNKRILLLSEGFGAGHTQAAHALSVGLRQLSPNVNTRVIELGAFLHPTLAPLVFNAYRKTLTSQPKLYGKLYRYQYDRSLNRFTQLALHRICYAQTAEIIRQLRPDTIVCTHPFPNVVVSRLKRAGLNVPLCTVITDYDAHGTWISDETNSYLVSTDEVKDKLLVHGIPSDRINITGIPVHPSFWKPHDKESIRSKFNLKQMPTVLVMGGGWGFMKKADDLLSYTALWRDQIQFIFCLGSNEKARLNMANNPQFKHPNIHLLGFTNEVDQLMEISDLLITKPGGMTCTEGLAKGIPMLFYNPIPGQEEENCQYFTAQGLGEELKSVDTLTTRFHELTHQYPSVANRRIMSQTRTYNPLSSLRPILQFVN
jgi:processive 1,2-diacylglycerol beta-glucosyltransferase